MDKRFGHFSNSAETETPQIITGSGRLWRVGRLRQVRSGNRDSASPRKQGVIRGAVHTVETFGCAATLDAAPSQEATS